jgi:serine/threonine protein phosphatase PrpC
VVTRALAGGDDPDVEVAAVPVRAGDRLMICSDGLSGIVSRERMEEIVAKGATLEETCQGLIAAANAAGGPDNITVVMLQIDVE